MNSQSANLAGDVLYPEQDVDTTLLYMAYRQMQAGALMTLVATVVFVGLLWPYFPSSAAKSIWMAALFAMVALRAALWVAFQRAMPGPASRRLWQYLFVAAAAAAGAAWSVGPMLMLPHAEGPQLAVLVSALLCVSAVSTNIMVAQQGAMRAFVVAALLPVAIEILIIGGDVHRLVAMIMVAGLVAVILVGTRSSRALRTMLEAQARLRTAIAEIEATQARYFDLYQLAPVGYCTLNGQGLIREANLMASTMLCRPADMLITQPLTRFIHKEDLHIYQQHHAQLIETGESQACELRLARTDGSVAWIHLAATAESDPDGARSARIVLTDSTARRQAEAARASAILDASMDAIISVNEFENIVVFSAAAEKLFQMPAADALGQTLSRFIPARFRANHRRDFRQFIGTGKSRRMGGQFMQVSALKKDGTEFPVEASISHVAIGGEHLFTVTLRDLTEREQAAEQLRQRELLFRGVFENAAVGISQVSTTGHFLQINEAFCETIGYSRDEVLSEGFTFQKITFADDLAADMAQVNQLLSGNGSGYAMEKRYIRKNGSIVWVYLSVHLLRDEAAAPLYFISAVQDISERKRAEAAHAGLEVQLRESQKMEAIGTLAGGIAHDFNNILATILGNTELAREDVGTNAPALQSLDEIRKAASRGRNLVQQILSFSRRQPTERKLIALAPIIEESVRLLRATLPARLSITTHCEPAVPAVQADANQLEQVLINIATNAMQAMRSNPGHIDIRLDTVWLDADLVKTNPALRSLHESNPGITVRLTVSDNGPGMDAATRDHIFEPFFTTKAVNEGTGLGLSVVHGIVLSHGGEIEVESHPGNGAIFTIYLPVADVPIIAAAPVADKPPAATSAAEKSNARHILYLDDDESLVFLVRRLLEQRGYRVSAYTDQQEALDALRAEPAAFDLLVTDYNMPGLSGLDVAREVRAIRADLPVAIASGFIDETLQAQAEGAGVRELIFKASAAEDLCEAFVRLAQKVGDDPQSKIT